MYWYTCWLGVGGWENTHHIIRLQLRKWNPNGDRSRYLGHGLLIASQIFHGVELLIHALRFCFCHQSPHNNSGKDNGLALNRCKAIRLHAWMCYMVWVLLKYNWQSVNTHNAPFSSYTLMVCRQCVNHHVHVIWTRSTMFHKDFNGDSSQYGPTLTMLYYILFVALRVPIGSTRWGSLYWCVCVEAAASWWQTILLR